MCLLRKITYGEFSEFVQENKVHIMYAVSIEIFSENSEYKSWKPRELFLFPLPPTTIYIE